MKLAQNDEKERTQDIRVSTNITFESLLLTSNTLAGLKSAGFYRPSPIQLQGIPLGKCGFDLLLEAKSGTGKTAVFTIVALEKLDLEKGLQAIMMAPTREIAVQICDVIQQLGAAYKGLNTMSVIGGMPVQEDILKIKNNNIHIVVGSPGRLRHLIQDKHLNISAVRLLVLDEADKLMEKSFLADINYIFSVLPKQKQIIMSSATFADSSKAFIEQYVQNAQHVCPENNSVLLGVKQTICIVKHNNNVVKQTQYRFEELLKILSQKQFKQCLIFCNYQTRVVELKKKLNKQKWPAEHLYGQQEQCDRLDALKMLQEYKCRILISTDLAARGIDASNVDLVINFEPPLEWQTYLHRIGRAGRFGSYGIAITIVSEGKEQKTFQLILESLQVPIHYFWNGAKDTVTDEPQNLTKQSDSFSTKCDKDESLKNIWNCLTTDTTNNKENVESFEKLCKSFETNERIESFAGLLSSFETHKSEFKKPETKNVELELVKEKMKTIKDFVSLSGDEMKVSKQNHEMKVEVNEHKSSNSNAEILQDLYIERHNNHDSLADDLTTSLINAGLPTSFGKQSNRFGKYSNRSSKKKKENLQSIAENTIEFELREPKAASQVLYNQDKFSENIKNNSSSSDSGFKNSTDHINSSNFRTVYKSNNEQLKQTNNNEYIDWYNKLKQRVREIEYSVYINEMSTL